MVYQGKSCVFYSIRTEIPVPLSFIGDIVDKLYLQFQGAGEPGSQGAGEPGSRGAGEQGVGEQGVGEPGSRAGQGQGAYIII